MNLGKFTGILGIAFILLLGYLFSKNRKLINYRLVFIGLLLQALTAFFILNTRIGIFIFSILAKGITSILHISKYGGNFVFGSLMDKGFIFAFQIAPIIIFICTLVSLLYYFGILQKIVKLFAWIFNKLLGVSGAEALANTSVAIVGQVESAIVIQPYLSKMTMSELLTIMTGGMACIAGAVLAVYGSLGIKIEYLLAASFMAIPGSFVMSKLFYPEDSTPVTKNTIKIDYKPKEKSFIEAILNGGMNGVKIFVGIIAMLIAFISLVALLNKFLFMLNPSLSIKNILGWIFTPFVYLLGVPKQDTTTVAELLGTKISLNEFIAYLDFSKLLKENILSTKSTIITTFILCGFANFGSIGIQIGGLSQMAPERKSDLARLGILAMICGALTSCISGCIVGIIY